MPSLICRPARGVGPTGAAHSAHADRLARYARNGRFAPAGQDRPSFLLTLRLASDDTILSIHPMTVFMAFPSLPVLHPTGATPNEFAIWR